MAVRSKIRANVGRPAPFIAVLCLLTACVLGGCGQSEPPRVVATIPPIHSLTSAVMQGVDEPYLLMDGRSSPHTYSLRPSDAKALAGAQLIIWVGPALESGLKKSIAMRKGGQTLELAHSEDLTTLSFFGDGHDHHEIAAEYESMDPHIWLSPKNAIVIVDEIEKALSQVDPNNADTYRKNAKALFERLKRLDSDLKQSLEPARQPRYAVLHNAFGYFADAMELQPAIVIKPRPDIPLGAASLRSALDRIEAQGIECILVEPQMNADLANEISKQAALRSVEIDPMGANIAPGPDHYEQTLLAISKGFRECLVS